MLYQYDSSVKTQNALLHSLKALKIAHCLEKQGFERLKAHLFLIKKPLRINSYNGLTSKPAISRLCLLIQDGKVELIKSG